jgi:hypothetical protein
MTPMVLLALVAEVPVTPSRDEARRWAQDKLGTDGEPGIVRRFLDWLTSLLPEGSDGSAPWWWSLIKLLVLVGAIVGIAVLASRTSAVSRLRETGKGGAVLDDDRLTAADHRRAADEYARAGRWQEAVVERFRAIARGLQERDLVTQVPGITADEVAQLGGGWLPGLAPALAEGARLFDDVRYGDATANESDHERLRVLDVDVQRTRPAARPQPTPGALAVPR